jgi:hypothetical protein
MPGSLKFAKGAVFSCDHRHARNDLDGSSGRVSVHPEEIGSAAQTAGYFGLEQKPFISKVMNGKAK